MFINHIFIIDYLVITSSFITIKFFKKKANVENKATRSYFESLQIMKILQQEEKNSKDNSLKFL